MEEENFERSLRAYVGRRPFESFAVHFVDGDFLTVDHPEALMLRGGLAVYFSPDGAPTLFDHRGVSRLTSVEPLHGESIPNAGKSDTFAFDV